METVQPWLEVGGTRKYPFFSRRQLYCHKSLNICTKVNFFDYLVDKKYEASDSIGSY